VHRQAKGADLSYPDEKFSFVAAARGPLTAPPGARIVRRPQHRKNLWEARRPAWGDAWDPGEHST
jgi:hypothetical protein